MPIENFLSSKPFNNLFTTKKIASSVERFFLNPNCESESKLCLSTKAMSRFCVNFSNNFEKVVRIVMGLKLPISYLSRLHDDHCIIHGYMTAFWSAKFLSKVLAVLLIALTTPLSWSETTVYRSIAHFPIVELGT